VSSFLRHGIADASIALLIWLKRNLQEVDLRRACSRSLQEFKSDKSMLALSLFGIIDWRPKEKPPRSHAGAFFWIQF